MPRSAPACPLSYIGPKGTDLVNRAESTAKQSIGMQLLQPLAVQYIAFSAGNILDVTGINQLDLKPMALKDLKDRYPVHAGGLHGDSRNPTGDQPVGQLFKVAGKSGELATGFSSIPSGTATKWLLDPMSMPAA